MIYQHPKDRGSWENRGIPGWYVGPAMGHFRCYTVLTEDGNKRIANTVQFYPECCELPKITKTDAIGMAIDDLTKAIKDENEQLPFATPRTEINKQLEQLVEVLQVTPGQEENSPFPKRPNAARPPRVNNRLPAVYPIGTIIRKKFPDGNYYEGEVKDYDPITGYYRVNYLDGDREDLEGREVKKYFKKNQKYSKKQVRDSALLGSQLPPHPQNCLIPTPKQSKATNFALNAGSLWDEELGKFAKYRELINHPNEEIRKTWIKSGEDEFGRLFQGFEPNGIKGMNVLQWISRSEVPEHKKVTYPRYTVAYRPEKQTQTEPELRPEGTASITTAM